MTLTPTTVLGMRLADLSLRDICEELTDIRRDLSVIADYQKGVITYAEFVREYMPRMISPSLIPLEKVKLEEALKVLQAEKAKRLETL